MKYLVCALLSTGLLLTGWLQGCSQPPEKPDIQYSLEARFDAAQYALRQNIKLQAIVDICETIDDATKHFSFKTQREWWDRNWLWVAAADAEFGTYVQGQQAKLGEITGQLDALRFILEAETQSGNSIRSDILASTQKDRACVFYLNEFGSGKADLNQNEQYYPVLASIQKDYPLLSTSKPHRVPQVAYGFKARKNVGRSVYDVQKLAEKSFCEKAQVLNIYNRWPKEIYGVYCENEPPRAITCEWAECFYGE